MLRLSDYDYHLPKEPIANAPASPRDSARLFVYDTKTDTVILDAFKNIEKHLPRPALLVFNDTKVVPARLWLTKETGGKIEVLLLMNEYRPAKTDRVGSPDHALRGLENILIRGIVDRKLIPGTTLFLRAARNFRW